MIELPKKFLIMGAHLGTLNEFLAEHAIKNEIRQLLSKYKHGNNIHEHRKQ